MFGLGYLLGLASSLPLLVVLVIWLDRRDERRARELYRFGPMPTPAARNLPAAHGEPRLVELLPADTHREGTHLEHSPPDP